VFIKASRIKLRFNVSKGIVSTEDLWDLPLTSDRGGANLNDIAKDLYVKLQDSETPDFVDGDTKTNSVLQLQFDIVKYVIDVKKKERDDALQAKARKDEIQHLQSIIARKEREVLEGASVEELQARIAELSE